MSDFTINKRQSTRQNSGIEFHPIQKSTLTFKTKIAIHIWRFVQAGVFRLSPEFCRGFRRSLLRLFGAKISPLASINNKARIDCPWNLEMEDYASVGEYTWIYALEKIHIGRYVCVGQYVKLITASHDYCNPKFSLVMKSIEIGEGSWLSVGVTVLPGVRIGDYCVVGAEALVTKDMPGMMVCAGNPCKPIKKRELGRDGN